MEDRARAKVWFVLVQPFAIAAGVPVSRLIMEHIHWLGWPGWRWVFILEGCPPILLGLVTLVYLTDRPHQAKWIPDDERAWLVAELEREARAKTAAGRVRIVDALRFGQTLLLAAIYFLIITGNQALVFFLPSITDNMKSMSISARTIVAASPYVCSAAGIFLNGIWAHRTNALRWHTAIPMLATGASLGLAILAGERVGLVIAFFCLAGLTSQAYLPAFWTPPSTLLGKSAAAAAIGFISWATRADSRGLIFLATCGPQRVTTKRGSGSWPVACCRPACWPRTSARPR